MLSENEIELLEDEELTEPGVETKMREILDAAVMCNVGSQDFTTDGGMGCIRAGR